ncbi:MAG TPA: VWA domain-containing protein [Casimicrobiaceae bacterium]|nr:VWA domain-containing protein [Casimicrobiaceae bacterium]
MTFLWPELLWLLLLVPVIVGVYLLLLRRKQKLAVRYASLSMVREAQSVGNRFRRHVPPLLFLIALTLMIVAIARPAAVVTLPSQHETIILAMDVSGSMRAVDVQPNRLTAAQDAARAFINDQPHNVRIGIVSFAGTAAVVQPPTENREDLLAAIDRFTLQRGTAVGSGILVALKTIFPEIEFDLGRTNPRINASDTGRGRPLGGRSADKSKGSDKSGDKSADKDADKPVQPGSYQSAAIILLTDGQTTTGPDPVESAKMAADRGVRVYTVGIGTVAGEIIGAEGWSMRVRLDEEALKQIANVTRADYFYAGTATDLKKIYEGMNAKMVLKKQQIEITALVVAAAALLATIAAGLSLVWFNRLL